MKRLFKFNLRFFMLAVTLVCLVIVLYPREEIERYGKQAIAAEALSRIGGVEVGQIPLPNNGYTYFLSWFIPRSHLCHVTTVSAERSVITNQDMRHLPNLPNLERLYLAGNHQITDEGIEHLQTFLCRPLAQSKCHYLANH